MYANDPLSRRVVLFGKTPFRRSGQSPILMVDEPVAAEAIGIERRRHDGRSIMFARGSLGAMTLAAFCLTIGSAQALDESKYPDFSGQWSRVGPPRWLRPGEKAPLTPEYQAR